jgi:hypothetical protein
VVALKKIFILLNLLGVAAMPLLAQTPVWQAAAGGRLPALSTPVGYTADNTVLFLARSTKAGVTSLGWFDPPRARS